MGRFSLVSNEGMVPLHLAHTLSYVLRECIDCVEVINCRTFQTVELDKSVDEKYKLPTTFSLDTQSMEDGLFLENMKTIYNTTDLMCTILENIELELNASKEFKFLTSMLQKFNDTKEIEHSLLLNDQAKRYKEILEEEHILDSKIKKIVEDNISQIDKVKTEYKQLQIMHDIKKGYMEKWEMSSNEQCALKSKIKANETKKEIREIKHNIRNELKIHVSLTNYMWDDIKEMQEQIPNWQSKFETDYDIKYAALLRIREKREDIRCRIIGLQHDYDTREKAINDYLAWKEWKKEKELEEEKNKLRESLLIGKRKTVQKSKIPIPIKRGTA